MGSHSARTCSGSSSGSGSQPADAIDASDSMSLTLSPECKQPESWASSVGRLRSETTSEALTSDPGLAAWTSYLRDGRARDFRRLLAGEFDTPTCGPTCARPLTSLDLPVSSSRTSTKPLGPWLSPTYGQEDSTRLAGAFARLIWELPTVARARFYWPTPTAKANAWAPSMRKWPAYQRLQDAIPTACPALFEWKMGFPEGWIGSASPERPRFLLWQRAHSSLWRDD